MTAIMFYHLEHKSWDQVLPGLLLKSRERGWRCVVQVGSADRVAEVSELLWKSDADDFFAHGTKADGRPERQPIWLTAEAENPNSATVKFFIEGAATGDVAALSRAVTLFDGQDEAAVAFARVEWKRLKEEGHDITYYQQDENLRWVDKSTTGDQK
jgi:DNA polymerase III subunit chi